MKWAIQVTLISMADSNGLHKAITKVLKRLSLIPQTEHSTFISDNKPALSRLTKKLDAIDQKDNRDSIIRLAAVIREAEVEVERGLPRKDFSVAFDQVMVDLDEKSGAEILAELEAFDPLQELAHLDDENDPYEQEY